MVDSYGTLLEQGMNTGSQSGLEESERRNIVYDANNIHMPSLCVIQYATMSDE
jgi:hypothetical protein